MDVDSNLDSVDAEMQLMLQNLAAQQPPKGGKGKGRGGKGRGTAQPAAGEDDTSSQTTPAAKTRTSGKGGGAKFRVCKGCWVKIPVSDLAPNFPGCWKCKSALDNINRLAMKQGAKAIAFVKKQREDPDACHQMVMNYLEHCPESNEGGKGRKRGQWSVTKYQERITAGSGIIRDRLGEMMPKKLYLEFAKTARGGGKSDEQAESQWLEWETKIAEKDESVMHDYKGEKGALRIWVHTKDELRFRASYMQEKEVVNEGEQLKKASQEDIDRLKSRALTNHEEFDAGLVSKALLANGESAFQSNDGFLTDVMELIEESNKDGAEKEGGDPEGPPNKRQKPNEDTEAKPTKPWVDRDRVVSATVRSATSQIKVFTTKVEQNLKKSRDALAEFERNEDESFKKNFEGELLILKNRIYALGLVVDGALVVSAYTFRLYVTDVLQWL